MTKETFNEMVWRLVSESRMQTVVVDNDHAYAIIKHRLDDLWFHMRTLKPEDEHTMVLGGLVAVAAAAQLAAENLSLVHEQQSNDDTRENLEKERSEVWSVLRDLVEAIGRASTPAERLQRDTPRFKFEFGEDYFKKLAEQVDELK